MKETQKTGGLIAPIVHCHLEEEDLRELIGRQRNPFSDLENVDVWAHCLLEFRKKLKSKLKDRPKDERLQEQCHLATWAWASATTVVDAWPKDDIETAVFHAVRFGDYLARLELLLKFEEKLQARQRIVEGGTQRGQNRREERDQLIRRVKAFMQATWCRHPQMQYKRVVFKAVRSFKDDQVKETWIRRNIPAKTLRE